MFHVELRQFPNVTCAFNLTRAELDSRILRPWVAGRAVDVNDRRWTPEKARLSIYEGPELPPERIGLGRGWANVTRAGEDVTARLVQALRPAPALDEFKRELITHARPRITLREVVELAGRRYPQSPVSERLALAEQAVWALLHEGRLRMLTGDAPLASEHWQARLLAWETWTQAAVALETQHSV